MSIYDDADDFRVVVRQGVRAMRTPKSQFVRDLLPAFQDGKPFVVTSRMASDYAGKSVASDSALRAWIKAQLETKSMARRGLQFSIVDSGETADGTLAMRVVGKRISKQ